LLDVSRADVERYVARHALPTVVDPSNADLRFARARIRHRLLPLLAAENPRVREALVGLAAAARGAAPRASTGLPGDIGRRAADVIEGLRQRGGTRRVDVAGHRVVEIAYGRGDDRGALCRGSRRARPQFVPGAGTYMMEGGSMALLLSLGEAAGAGAPFDADALAWPLVLRVRRPGDRMRPRGGRGSRKLADLLIDAKVPRPSRDRLPVLTTADDVVLFVPGLRPAEQGRPSARTSRFLEVVLVERSAR